MGAPQSGSHQTSPLVDRRLERGGIPLAGVEKQPQVFLLGNRDNSTSRLFPLKDHHTWRGTDAPLQYLDFGAVEVSDVYYSDGWCLEKHIVSAMMPGAHQLFHCLEAPPA